MKPRYDRVGVFGMGLLGGSVALGLREHGVAREIHGFDIAAAPLEAALGLGVVDRVHTSLGPWVSELDLGILAAPVGALVPLGEQLGQWARPDSTWTDVGSVKAPIVDALDDVLPGFVGGHPMAGSEQAGVQHAYAGLLENAIWVLTPTQQTTPERLTELEELVEALGAIHLTLDAPLHDRLVARVSHLPYLLAVALTRMVAADPHSDLLVFLAAGGFRDITRVASGSPWMSRDMVHNNRARVRSAIQDLRVALGELEGMLDDAGALLGAAEEAKRTRDSVPIVRRSLLPRRFDAVIPVPDRPGELATLTGCLGAAEVNIKDIEVLAIRESGGAIRMGFRSAEDRAAARIELEKRGYEVREVG